MLYLSIALKLLVGMAGILFFLRLTGKIQMAKLTPLDNVNALVLGAIVGSTIYVPGIGLWFQLYAMAIWTVLNLLLRFLLHKNFFRNLIQGRDEILIENGLLNLKVMKRNNLTMDELRAKLRELDIYSLKDVERLRFETDGQFTVHQKNQGPESYLLIDGGELMDEARRAAGVTREWVMKQVRQAGYNDTKKIYAAEWTPGIGFYVIGSDGKISDTATEEIPQRARNRLEESGAGSPAADGTPRRKGASAPRKPGNRSGKDKGKGSEYSGSRTKKNGNVAATPPTGLGTLAATSRRVLPDKAGKGGGEAKGTAGRGTAGKSKGQPKGSAREEDKPKPDGGAAGNRRR